MTARTIAVGAHVCERITLQPFRCSLCGRPLVATSQDAPIGISDNGIWITAPFWMTCECGEEMLRPIPPSASDSYRRPVFPRFIGIVEVSEWGTAILDLAVEALT